MSPPIYQEGTITYKASKANVVNKSIVRILCFLSGDSAVKKLGH